MCTNKYCNYFNLSLFICIVGYLYAIYDLKIIEITFNSNFEIGTNIAILFFSLITCLTYNVIEYTFCVNYINNIAYGIHIDDKAKKTFKYVFCNIIFHIYNILHGIIYNKFIDPKPNDYGYGIVNTITRSFVFLISSIYININHISTTKYRGLVKSKFQDNLLLINNDIVMRMKYFIILILFDVWVFCLRGFIDYDDLNKFQTDMVVLDIYLVTLIGILILFVAIIRKRRQDKNKNTKNTKNKMQTQTIKVKSSKSKTVKNSYGESKEEKNDSPLWFRIYLKIKKLLNLSIFYENIKYIEKNVILRCNKE